MTEVLKAGVLSDEIDLGALAHNAAEQAEEFVRMVRTKVIVFRFWAEKFERIFTSGVGGFLECVSLSPLAEVAAGQ